MSNERESIFLPIWEVQKPLVTYQDQMRIEAGTSTEPFVVLQRDLSLALFGSYGRLADMSKLFPEIPVRQEVGVRLVKAAQRLQTINPSLALQVTYGFRSLEVQQTYYQQRSLELFNSIYLTEAQKEIIHQFVAVPEVAGHPTGGAVDLVLFDSTTQGAVDCGSTIYDLNSPTIQAFSSGLTAQQLQARLLLRQIMMEQGFAPYDGEWWHFSYGDKEWAAYYGLKKAIYPIVTTQQVRIAANEAWVQLAASRDDTLQLTVKRKDVTYES